MRPFLHEVYYLSFFKFLTMLGLKILYLWSFLTMHGVIRRPNSRSENRFETLCRKTRKIGPMSSRLAGKVRNIDCYVITGHTYVHTTEYFARNDIRTVGKCSSSQFSPIGTLVFVLPYSTFSIPCFVPIFFGIGRLSLVSFLLDKMLYSRRYAK